MNVQFIDSSGQQILTTYHPPLQGGQTRGVLIAPPIGTEYLRTHWALRRLTQQLTRAGFPVIRLDYRGVGDSSLDISEVHSLSEWHDDLREAAWSLRSQSGCNQITIVGLRFGAAIAIGAASDNEVIEGLAEIIAWQPVLDGQDYLQSQRSMQACMLDLWPSPINAISNRTHEEILGSLYSRQLLGEIESINFRRDPGAGLPEGIRYVDIDECDFARESQKDSSSPVNSVKRSRATTGSSTVENPAWDDLRYLEIAWLPLSEPKQIVKRIQSSAKEAQS